MGIIMPLGGAKEVCFCFVLDDQPALRKEHLDDQPPPQIRMKMTRLGMVKFVWRVIHPEREDQISVVELG